MKRKFILMLSVLTMLSAHAQEGAVESIKIRPEQIVIANDTLINQSKAPKEKSVYRKLSLPAVLVAYGALGLASGEIQDVNLKIRDKVNKHVQNTTSVDDYTRYAPVISVYALNAVGIKGKHNFRDRTIILATSHIIMCGSVMGLKKLAGIERPDGSKDNSFPSGHTATAFAGAEFLMQEYKDVSIWYGVAGYVIAAGTGLCRIYNNRHWLTDVATGAGIGILSTKLAYWIHPFIQKQLFGEEKKLTALAAPFYNGEQLGLSLVVQF